MKNGPAPLWLKSGVLMFAGSLMTAFVMIRGRHDGEISASPPHVHAQAPTLVDSPFVIRHDTAAIQHKQVPGGPTHLQPAAEGSPAERTYLSSSKSGIVVPQQRSFLSSSKSLVIPDHAFSRNAVIDVTDQQWKRWNDSVTRAEAMRTLIVDRYGAYPPTMITVDSLQRRVERKRHLLSGNKAPMSTWRVEADMKYLDSLLNVLIKP